MFSFDGKINTKIKHKEKVSTNIFPKGVFQMRFFRLIHQLSMQSGNDDHWEKVYSLPQTAKYFRYPLYRRIAIHGYAPVS